MGKLKVNIVNFLLLRIIMEVEDKLEMDIMEDMEDMVGNYYFLCLDINIEIKAKNIDFLRK